MNNDQHHYESFTPEQVDEQIEQFKRYPHSQQSDPGGEQLINDLSLIYGEHNSQRDRLWQRISAGMEQQPQTVRKDSPMAQAQQLPPLMLPHHSRFLRRPRWQLIFSVLVAGLIIASTLWFVGSKLSIATSTVPVPVINVKTDSSCPVSKDAGWMAICQHHYEQSIKQSQTIKTNTLGTLKFTVESAYIDGNRAIIQYTYTPTVDGNLYELTDYPQLSTTHGLKFPGILGDTLPTAGNNRETIMTFETSNLTQHSGNLSLRFIDEISLFKHITPTAQQPDSMLLPEKHTVTFNFSIKIQPEYKVIAVQQTQTVPMGNLTFQRIIVTPSATRLIMSGISLRGDDMTGSVIMDGQKGMNIFAVYFGKQHVTDKHYVMDRLLQKKPPVFEIFYFQPLFNQFGQWFLHWPDYTLDSTGKHLVDKGYTYKVTIK